MPNQENALRKMLRPHTPPVARAVQLWQSDGDMLFRSVAKDLYDLDLTIRDLEGERLQAHQAIETLPTISLTLLLNAENTPAVCVVDGALIDGLIEQQMLGRIMIAPRNDRPVTAIDAGMSEEFVKGVVNKLATLPDVPRNLTGLSVNKPEQDRAALKLALGDAEFDILKAKLDLGPGVKTGAIELWVPVLPEQVRPTSQSTTATKASLDKCEVALQARLNGCKAAIGDLASLSVDTVLPLPKSALLNVSLEDCRGNRFATGRLGQLNGNRAVRIAEDAVIADDNFTPTLPEASAIPGAAPILEPAELEIESQSEALEPLAELPQIEIADMQLDPTLAEN